MEANKQQSYTSNKDKVPNLTFEGTGGGLLGLHSPRCTTQVARLGGAGNVWEEVESKVWTKGTREQRVRNGGTWLLFIDQDRGQHHCATLCWLGP